MVALVGTAETRKKMVGDIERVENNMGVRWYEYTDTVSGDVLQFSTLKDAWLSYRETLDDSHWKAGWDARIIRRNRKKARRHFRKDFANLDKIAC